MLSRCSSSFSSRCFSSFPSTPLARQPQPKARRSVMYSDAMQRLCDARAALVSGSACASKDGKRKPSAATLPVKAGAAIGPIVPAAASCVPPAVIAVQGLVEDIFR